tara:strand:+ start:560 stop:3151 length:2592 start_codon:yes stop_codon:yes gene_type:complete
VKAQNNISVLQNDSIDSLAHFAAIDSLYNYLRIIQKKIGAFSKIDSLTKKGKNKIKLDYFEDHEIFREPKTRKEYDLVRWYYANKYYQHRNYFGDFENSIPIGLKASEYAYDSLFLDRRAFYVEFELANNYSRLDDHSRALYYMKKCIPGAVERKDNRLLNLCYLEIGDIYLRTKKYTEAKNYYLKATDVSFDEDGVSNQIAIISRFRKLSFETEDGEFLDWVDKELPLHEKNKNGSKYQERRNNLDESLGDYYKEKSNWKEALIKYQKSERYYNTSSSSLIKRELAKLYVKFAECYSGIDNDRMVRQSIMSGLKCLLPNQIESIVPSDTVLYAENTFGSIFDIGYKYYLKKYNSSKNTVFLDTAFQLIKLGIFTNDLINKKIFYSTGKLLSTDLGRNRVNHAIDALWYLKDKLGQKDFNSELRYLLDESKDYILKDQIELKSKLSRLDSLNNCKANHLINQIVKTINRGGSKQDIVKYQTELDMLLGATRSVDQIANINEDCLEYVITENQVYLNINIGSKKAFHQLGEKSILQKLIDNFLLGLKQQEEIKSLDEKSSLLCQFLIPKEIELPFEIAIVADGIIALVPFDILNHKKSYLIFDHLLKTKTYNNTESSKEESEIKSVLCINPNYDKGEIIDDDKIDRAGFYYLPFAQTEVDEMQLIFKDKMDVENSIQSIEILEKLKSSDIFHFTGHAKATDTSSFLVLKEKDSLIHWGSDQIYHANLDLELVTLSACETGLGKIINGDGINSVARSFISAGAKSVIYSLWTVNDKSTSNIMVQVYNNLMSGMKKHEAIRNAKLDFFDKANPQLKHPYYWGGFIVTGDMNNLKLIQSKTNVPLFIFLGLGVFSIIVLTIIKTKHL